MAKSKKMPMTRLGNSGLWVSRVCLGAMTFGDSKWVDWMLPEDESRKIIKRSLELGINFFDTADIYSIGVSEQILGRALKDFAKREEVVIATKVYNSLTKPFRPAYDNSGGLGRKHIFEACEASLERLGTDYIDLYIIHRFDPNTPIEETMCALNDLVRSGKVRYIGASSMYAWQFAHAQYVAEKNGWTKFISMQNLYNLIYREEEKEMIQFCRFDGVGVTPWSPLAGGFLAGKRPRGADKKDLSKRAKSPWSQRTKYIDQDYAILDRVKEIAQKYNATPAQIAFAWTLAKPGISSPIIGVTKLAHLEESVAAVHMKLSEDDLKYLEELYEPKPEQGALTQPKL